MSLVKIISAAEFMYDARTFLEGKCGAEDQVDVNITVNEIIAAVRAEGDEAVWRYTRLYEREVPEAFEVSKDTAKKAWESLKTSDPDLASSLSFAADNIRKFGEFQKKQLVNFEAEIVPGIISGQRVIPVERAAVYVPGGRFPLISSALMGLVPADVAGVREKILVSPPGPDGIPDSRILAAGYLAGADRFFALGGAQAIAALALGTESIPRVDLITGAGNKYVSAAKRILYGEVGIDLVAGPTDLLIITDMAFMNIKDTDLVLEAADVAAEAADIIASDMLAQAEHDPDARSRVLVPDRGVGVLVERALELRLPRLSTKETAAASLEAGGLIIVYDSIEEALEIANRIAPEHLELHTVSTAEWVRGLKNYGSLFIGSCSAEILGDYSAGINHTLPTSGSARFTGGLSVRNYLKTVTTLHCVRSEGYVHALTAAKAIALAEGLKGHAESAAIRLKN